MVFFKFSGADKVAMLLDEDEKTATLEELFAFIDCSDKCSPANQDEGRTCNMEANQEPSVLGGGSGDEESSKLQPVPALETAQKKVPRRRRKRIGWSSSTGLQRRKRAGLLFLRQHVWNLEVYLQQLKSPHTPDTRKPETPFQWKELAKTQLVERLQSEETNRTLKTLVNNQMHAHDALGILFAGNEEPPS